MDNKKKITFNLNPNSLLDPANIRSRQIAEEEDKRFDKISEQILEILKKENVLLSEIPRVVSTFSDKINAKIDNTSIDKIIKLL